MNAALAATDLRFLQSTTVLDQTAPLPNEAEEPLPRRFGKYRLLEQIGRGGMGRVFLAEDITLLRKVAVKFAEITPTSDPSMIERFRREAEAMAQLEHSNICRVYDYGNVDGQYYIAMEHVRGMTLSECLAQKGRLSESQTLAVVAQLAGALEFAHSRKLSVGESKAESTVEPTGLLHRDLKPSNVMFDHQGRVKLMDFGLAFDLRTKDDRLTQQGFVGTPAYMAPEQCSSQTQLSYATDIYALGILAFEMLTGRLPFDGNQIIAKLAKDPPSVRTYRPEISEPLRSVVDKMIARDPEHRQRSMRTLLDELAPQIQRISAQDWASLRVIRPDSPGKRRWAGVIAFAIVSIAILVTVLISFRSGTTTVTVVIDERLHEDQSLSVFIDGNRLTLTGNNIEKVQLEVGQHEWTVRKGNAIVRNPQRFEVLKNGTPVILISGEDEVASEKEVPEPATENASPSLSQEQIQELGFAELKRQQSHDFENDVQNGPRGNQSGRYYIDNGNGSQAWNKVRYDVGYVEVSGRVADGAVCGWSVNLTNRGIKKGVQIRVFANGEIKFGNSLFQKTAKFPTRTLMDQGELNANNFHTIGIAIRRRSLLVFLDGKPISGELKLSYDLTPGVVALGADGHGRVEFERVAFWSSRTVGAPSNRVGQALPDGPIPRPLD